MRTGSTLVITTRRRVRFKSCTLPVVLRTETANFEHDFLPAMARGTNGLAVRRAGNAFGTVNTRTARLTIRDRGRPPRTSGMDDERAAARRAAMRANGPVLGFAPTAALPQRLPRQTRRGFRRRRFSRIPRPPAAGVPSGSGWVRSTPGRGNARPAARDNPGRPSAGRVAAFGSFSA